MMKVYDIISERQDLSEVAGLVKGALNIAKAAKTAKTATTATKAAKTATNTGTKTAKTTTGTATKTATVQKAAPKKVSKKPKTKKPPKDKPPTETPNKPEWWEKRYAAIQAKEAQLAQNGIKVAALKSYTDDVVKFLTMGLIAKESYVYWDESSKLDALLASGQITQQEYDQRLTYLRGMLLTTIIAPKVGQMGANLLGKLGPRLIPFLMKVTGNPNAALATRYLTSAAVRTALIAWFGAGDGKQWLSNTFGTMITGVGDIPKLLGEIWEWLKATYQVTTGNLPQGFEKGQQSQQSDGEKSSNPWSSEFDKNTGLGGQKRIFKDPFAGERGEPGVL